MNELKPWLIAGSVGMIIGAATALGLVQSEKAPAPGGGGDQLSAVEICRLPETEVFLVTDTASGEKQYQAKYDTLEVRYDLTWQVEAPSTIAVEELRGADFRPRADQYSPEFAACIAGKNVVPVQGSH